MKRTIEVSSSFTGKISTGAYENSSPMFHAKEIFEVNGISSEEVNEIIEIRQSELQEICLRQFNRSAEIIFQEKIAKAYKNIRFYDAGEGLKFPSVTSVVNMDAEFFVSPDELAQYGARGTVIHKQVELFLKDGKWREPKEIPEIAFEVMTVLKGTLGLLLDDVNFPAFFKEYPFKLIAQEKTVINQEFRFGGRLDMIGIIEKSNPGKWEKIEGVQFDVPTIFDVKTATSLDKTKGFTQLGAYAKCEPEVKQLILIHLNKENVSGYAKPIISNKLEAYWAMFLKQRQLFAERYGV